MVTELRGVAKIYQRYEFENEMRKAWASWSKHVLVLAAQPSDVVKLKKHNACSNKN
jgi:hypothetical protein